MRRRIVLSLSFFKTCKCLVSTKGRIKTTPSLVNPILLPSLQTSLDTTYPSLNLFNTRSSRNTRSPLSNLFLCQHPHLLVIYSNRSLLLHIPFRHTLLCLFSMYMNLQSETSNSLVSNLESLISRLVTPNGKKTQCVRGLFYQFICLKKKIFSSGYINKQD